MIKLLAVAALALSIQACATGGPPGDMKPNSLENKEMLEAQRGFVIVGPAREKKAVREFLLNRPADSVKYIEVDGSRLVPRSVQVEFDYSSTKYNPTGEQRVHIRQLVAIADRVIVQGHTVCNNCKESDLEMARLRAETAKRALIDTGMPADKISVTHDASAYYVKGGVKRLVNMEFIIDDFGV